MLYIASSGPLLLQENINVSFGIWVLLILSLVIIVGGIGLFIYAYLTGQFDDINKGAQLPFDEEEPAGQRTDQIFRDDTDNLGNVPPGEEEPSEKEEQKK
ncbi:MAG: cbb3-type cytochrome oxidase assembly protein [Cyclonatronaceae bacterium]